MKRAAPELALFGATQSGAGRLRHPHAVDPTSDCPGALSWRPGLLDVSHKESAKELKDIRKTGPLQRRRMGPRVELSRTTSSGDLADPRLPQPYLRPPARPGDHLVDRSPLNETMDLQFANLLKVDLLHPKTRPTTPTRPACPLQRMCAGARPDIEV